MFYNRYRAIYKYSRILRILIVQISPQKKKKKIMCKCSSFNSHMILTHSKWFSWIFGQNSTWESYVFVYILRFGFCLRNHLRRRVDVLVFVWFAMVENCACCLHWNKFICKYFSVYCVRYEWNVEMFVFVLLNDFVL